MSTARRDLARYDARQLKTRDARAIAGVDEVGRGSLAGPVVAAAVILPAGARLPGVDDSKQLTAAQRAIQALAVRAVAVAIGISFVGPRTIDAINIRSASLLAMRRAVERSRVRFRRAGGAGAEEHRGALLILVDGLDVIPGLDLRQQPVVGGDGESLAIAAASIIAKTVRDGFMVRLAAEWPAYGFERHKGYGTEEHLAALELHGPCSWHRFSYAPVAQIGLFPG